jgi:hypothetical protein
MWSTGSGRISRWRFCLACLAVRAICRDPGNTAEGDSYERQGRVVFAALFALFFIGWLIFDMPVALGLVNKSVGWYAREIDPIFLHPPSWLRTVGWFAFAFGPFYLLAAYGFSVVSSGSRTCCCPSPGWWPPAPGSIW